MKYRFAGGANQYVAVHGDYISVEDFVETLAENLFGCTTPTCRFEVVDREEGELMDTVHDVAVVRKIENDADDKKKNKRKRRKRRKRWRSRSRETQKESKKNIKAT